MIFIYSTAANQEEADKLSKLILENKLAACVNSWPIRSRYVWEGVLKDETEIVMIVKTSEEKFQEIEQLIVENHSYDVPCIVAIDIKRMNPEFKQWVVSALQ